MEILFKINNKDIPKINTTILHTSKSNYNVDMFEFINNNCEVIIKTSRTDINDIPLKILDSYNCLELAKKDELTNNDEIKINILKSLCSEKEVIVFYDILNYEDCFVFVPCRFDKVLILDRKDWSKIYVEIPQTDWRIGETSFNFFTGIININSLYLFGFSYPGILKMDLRN